MFAYTFILTIEYIKCVKMRFPAATQFDYKFLNSPVGTTRRTDHSSDDCYRIL